MEDRRLLQNLIYKLSRTRWRNFNRLIGARCKSTGDKQEEMTEIAGGRRRESLRASKDDVFRKVWRKTICFYKLTYAKKGRETIFLLFLKLRLDSQMSSFWRNRFLIQIIVNSRYSLYKNYGPICQIYGRDVLI